jgi:hypothetical protein
LISAREKLQVTCQCKPTTITANFSTETLKVRRARNEVFQALKENNCKPRLLYPAKLSLIIKGKIKTFYDKQKLNQFMTTKPGLQKMLKGVLYRELIPGCQYYSHSKTRKGNNKKERIVDQSL